MTAFLITLNVIVSLILIGVILLQPGSKGGGLGAAFGGGGGANSAFGAQGSAPFLSKMTYWVAGIFLATSLFIEMRIVNSNRSVLEKKPILSSTSPAPAPQMPGPAQK